MSSEDATTADAEELEAAEAQAQPLRHGHALKTLLRVGLSIAALVIAALVLKPVYEDLDLATVRRAIGSLSAGEWTAFLAVFASTIWANGFLTASVVPKLPIRRGVTAYLGSSAVSSTFPVRAISPCGFSCTGRGATRPPSPRCPWRRAAW